ncbi:hypothetical protein P3S67_011002 [Capsicum chacoense]
MKVIALSYTNLTRKLPTTICDHFPNLEGLYLMSNYLYVVIPPNLEKCRKLQILALGKNEYVGTLPRELANLTALTTSSTQILHLEGEIPVELGNLQKLQQMGLSLNEFTGSPCKHFHHVIAADPRSFTKKAFRYCIYRFRS